MRRIHSSQMLRDADKGKFQLEGNGGYGHNEDDGGTIKTTRIREALAYGISDPVDIILVMHYERTGIDDLGVVTREAEWRFYENKVGEKNNLWHASLASTVEVLKDLKLAGDTGIEEDIGKNLSVHNAFVLGGAIYAMSENFHVDFGIKGGLTKPGTDCSVLAGITSKF